jgi:hypothetical protein
LAAVAVVELKVAEEVRLRLQTDLPQPEQHLQ